MSDKNGTTTNVNAAQLNYDDLVRLFEPNTTVVSASSDKSVGLCSYDKVAAPLSASQSTYYLVAKRGIGKTHILRLLQENLIRHKHLILPIELNLAKSPITVGFNTLVSIFPKEPKSNLWQLAILEEVLIELFNSYINNTFFKSAFYKLLPFTNTFAN